MDDARPWYDAAFEGGYLDVYPHRDLAAARAEVAGLVEHGVRGRVLDLGCGAGRHLVALGERGLAAFGLDRSAALLARVPAEVRGRTVRGDFRALPLASGAFDAVLMLFSSFGYFEDADNARVLGEIERVLRPGGLVVLELMNPARVRATLVPESRTTRGASEVLERRRLRGARVVKDVTLRDAAGAERSWREDVRLYEPGEMQALLAAAKLAWLRTEGDFEGGAFAPESPRQLVWARKAAASAPRA